jgi:hypothetical protein
MRIIFEIILFQHIGKVSGIKSHNTRGENIETSQISRTKHLKFPKKPDLTKHWFGTDLVLRWFSGQELVGISFGCYLGATQIFGYEG